jgi:hypothetical protein
MLFSWGIHVYIHTPQKKTSLMYGNPGIDLHNRNTCVPLSPSKTCIFILWKPRSCSSQEGMYMVLHIFQKPTSVYKYLGAFLHRWNKIYSVRPSQKQTSLVHGNLGVAVHNRIKITLLASQKQTSATHGSREVALHRMTFIFLKKTLVVIRNLASLCTWGKRVIFRPSENILPCIET